MLLVVASHTDDGAASLPKQWAGHNVRLLTCRSLSAPGWVFDPARAGEGRFVTDVGVAAVSELDGVVSLLPGVHAGELPHIAEADRLYVASEMHAFLLAWLSSLTCPVLGRPTPYCLTGPHLRHEEWLRVAAMSGLPVRTWHRRIPGPQAGGEGDPSAVVDPDADPVDGTPPATVTVTVVGSRIVCDPSPTPLADATRGAVAAMTTTTGANLMTVTLVSVDGEWVFAGAVPVVDVGRSDVAQAVLDEALGSS